MKYKDVIFGLLSIFVLTFNAEAGGKEFKVQFVVPASNEVTDRVKSYITRELRALHDVEMVEKDPNLNFYHVSVYPISLKLANGMTWAVAISYVFEKDGMVDHCVLSGPLDMLKTLCENIVARFDTKWLEPKRYK